MQRKSYARNAPRPVPRTTKMHRGREALYRRPMAPSPRSARLTAALCLASTLAARAAHADPPDARVALLERDATHALVWWTGFTVGYTASAVAQTSLALSLDDPGLRIDAVVGSVSSWLGVGGMLISPIPRVWRAASEARRTGRIDEALALAANAEREARAWHNHMLCAIVAVAAGGVLWLGYDRPATGALNAGLNLVVGEINLYTQPRRAYNARNDARVAWQFAPTLNGVQVVGAW